MLLLIAASIFHIKEGPHASVTSHYSFPSRVHGSLRLIIDLLAFPTSHRKVSFRFLSKVLRSCVCYQFSFILINMSSALLYNFSDCSSPSPLPTPIAGRGLSYQKLRAASANAGETTSRSYSEHELLERASAIQEKAQGKFTTRQVHELHQDRQPSHAGDNDLTPTGLDDQDDLRGEADPAAGNEPDKDAFGVDHENENRSGRIIGKGAAHLSGKKKQQHNLRSLMSILALRYSKPNKRNISQPSLKAGESIYDNDTYTFVHPPSSGLSPTPLGSSDQHSEIAPRSAQGLAVSSLEGTSPKRKVSGPRRRSILRRSIDTGRFSNGRERRSLEDAYPVSLDFDESIHQRAVQRAEKLKDLVQSEESYVADLKILHDVCSWSEYTVGSRCLLRVGVPSLSEIYRSSVDTYPRTFSTKCGRNLEAPSGPLGATQEPSNCSRCGESE